MLLEEEEEGEGGNARSDQRSRITFRKMTSPKSAMITKKKRNRSLF